MIFAPTLVEISSGMAYADAAQPQSEPDTLAQEIREANAAWVARWPKHCPACNGWGGFSKPLTDAYSGTFTWCTARRAEQCHRCGGLGLNAQGKGPCSVCAWNFDDGAEDPIDFP